MFDNFLPVKKLPTVEAVKRTNYKNANGEIAIKIRVTSERAPRYFSILHQGQSLYLTMNDWEEVKGSGKLKGTKREIRDQIDRTKVHFRDLIEAICKQGPFTFDKLERALNYKPAGGGFLSYFDKYREILLSKGQTGTYMTYESPYNALKTFLDGRDIHPSELTLEKLLAFEAYLKEEKFKTTATGKCEVRKANQTTVAIYMRTLRAVFNFAIELDPSLAPFYPFTRNNHSINKYKIRGGSGKKGDALEDAELFKYLSLKPIPKTPEWEAYHIWLFLFWCDGLNITDFARLKNSDIKGGWIRYVREKTKNTKENVTEKIISISPEIDQVIRNLGKKSNNPNDYVFDVLVPGLDSLRERALVKQKTKMVNKWLKKWCKENGLPPLTTYWARHTYATFASRHGFSVEKLKQSLIHSDVATTQRYIDRFNAYEVRSDQEKFRAIVSDEYNKYALGTNKNAAPKLAFTPDLAVT